MIRAIRYFLLLCLLPPFVSAADDESPPGFNEATFSGLEMRSIGPAMMSGRISDIAINPENPSTWYVGVGSGGVFKTVNGGTTWQAIFDDQDSYSIGSVTLDPNDPETVWIGTGENVSGRHIAYGSGVFRSRDGGQTWQNMGLRDSEHIGMIRVDPRDSNVVYVAAQGPLWSAGGERGLYKSIDGGVSWSKILGDGLGNTDIDDQYTGVSEVHFDPRDPDVIYAVAWQRYRNVAVLMDGGPGSGIHKSTDGGATWRALTEGLPDDDMGKVGLAISPQNPDIVYATIELAHRKGGFYRSSNNGESWEKQNDYISGGTGPHYYQEIFASPHQFDRVYQMDVHLHKTEDGGKAFERMASESKHVDHHAMAFHPDDEDYLLVGNDGGVYESLDLGKTWRFISNLPISQFYKVAVDYEEPFYNVYGGTQDNSSLGGPHRTDNNVGIRNSDWYLTLGADGHQSAADPDNPNIIYANWQEGNLTRHDRQTGESVYIRPQPGADEVEERFNWDAPILISPHNSETLYFASYRVWKSDDRGDSWEAISGDLTRNQDRLRQPLMGRLWSFDSNWDLSAMSQFNTITSLSESPVVAGLIYAGTDDGLIQVSEDDGSSWRTGGSLPGVPDNYFVNDIKADLHDADTVYVVVDDHKSGDFSPYILKSENRGRSWRSITSNIPERHVVWRLVQDHVNPDLMFAATEFGIFFTVDGGGAWTKLSGGVPNIAFRDLAIQQRENDLVGASFGRSIYILDDYSALRQVSANVLRSGNVLFPVRRAHWYLPKRPHSCATPGCVDSQGDSYFVSPNPPFGAVFTYYLADGIKSLQAQRKAAEADLIAENQDVQFPTWEDISAEEQENEPAIVFTVSDSAGNVIRHIEAPAAAGFHRINWDLRYPAIEAWVPEDERNPNSSAAGVLVVPGTYRVDMYSRSNGELNNLEQQQTFEVVSIRNPTLPGSSQEERVVFQRQVDELRRAVDGTRKALDDAVADISAIEEVLQHSTADMRLHLRANTLQADLLAQRDRLSGNPTQGRFSVGRPVPVTERLRSAGYNPHANAYGPTDTQQESLRIARELYAELTTTLQRLVDQELGALKRELDAAGVPWSPGRGIQNAN